MLVGLVGKPNVGKSTFFTAATTSAAEIGNYPFTTIEANRGVAFARFTPCPHTLIDTPCTPRAGRCVDGVRYIPVEVLDVAGLVPGASEGKGLGNKFLDDLRQADALIHVVDATGATDAEGNPVPPGTRDPLDDVAFLEAEVTQWIGNIIGKGFERAAKGILKKGDLERVLSDRLSGLGVTDAQIVHALHHSSAGEEHPTKWTPEHFASLAQAVRAASKPIVIAANKADVADPERVAALTALDGVTVVPTSAESELALRRATDAGLVTYEPGAASFTVNEPGKLNAAQTKALDRIQHDVLDRFGSTGVQTLLETMVFERLDRIVAFPVEDETHLTDKEGRVLPDAFLLKRGTTAKEMAFKVHTELGEKFIRAVDARKKRPVGADHALEHGDVVRIVANR